MSSMFDDLTEMIKNKDYSLLDKYPGETLEYIRHKERSNNTQLEKMKKLEEYDQGLSKHVSSIQKHLYSLDDKITQMEDVCLDEIKDVLEEHSSQILVLDSQHKYDISYVSRETKELKFAHKKYNEDTRKLLSIIEKVIMQRDLQKREISNLEQSQQNIQQNQEINIENIFNLQQNQKTLEENQQNLEEKQQMQKNEIHHLQQLHLYNSNVFRKIVSNLHNEVKENKKLSIQLILEQKRVFLFFTIVLMIIITLGISLFTLK